MNKKYVNGLDNIERYACDMKRGRKRSSIAIKGDGDGGGIIDERNVHFCLTVDAGRRRGLRGKLSKADEK